MTLVVVLIGMVALLFAALALLRSVDTNTVIAGNSAFRGAVTQLADIGTETAIAKLPTILSTSQETLIAGQYYPSLTSTAGGLTWTSTGLPPSSVWSTAPQMTSSNTTGVPTGYTVQYIIERLCTGSLPVTNMKNNCSAAPIPPGTFNAAGSQAIGSQSINKLASIYYRITVYVNGPHNTSDTIQTVVSN